MPISDELRRQLLIYQRNEITEHHIYRQLARRMRNPDNRGLLEKIAADELRHYEKWRTYTQQDVAPDRWAVWKYGLISRIFGFTFGMRLMERDEAKAQTSYDRVREEIPDAEAIMRDENQHEAALLGMLEEERLRYMGSIVLGLNDALVELTGTLAGLTLALQNTKLIALTGSITGIAAGMSMAASEYLATKTEKSVKNPFRASLYTGAAYLVTVLVLVVPYLFFSNYFLCLGCTLAGAVVVIAAFNYYISVAKDESFKRRFLEMTALSFGVAAISFLIGWLLRTFLGVEV